MENEATARIWINRLLESAGWRLLPEGDRAANVQFEVNVKGEGNKTGQYADYVLLDDRGYPLAILEAKASEIDPLVGKEQARGYAQSQGCFWVLLSNGQVHYLWNLRQGNPQEIANFPSPAELAAMQAQRPRLTVKDGSSGYRTQPQAGSPRPQAGRSLGAILATEQVDADYIVLTQRPQYRSEVGWKQEAERSAYIRANKLRFLRDYQLEAIHQLQTVAQTGQSRFLFEMATGTGKTLTSAAVIKLFLRSGAAHRVLFLVDRIELEEQAHKAFQDYLGNDYQSVIYKENRDDWRRAEIVVTTVQSLLTKDKYLQLFRPQDFNFIISDEAHRSINGNARSVFEYFGGAKLGLTATPKDYLRNVKAASPKQRDPRAMEQRLLRDTYETFGCASGEPTFRYGLLDGVRAGFLVNPTVVDARTEVTTALLSKQGFIVSYTDDNGQERQESYQQRQFERKFFSPHTNQLFCHTFLENALRDPISGEIGKAIVFAVSRKHAGKLVQIFNQMADRLFPGRYQSDFAVQITSDISQAQQFTTNFTNNNLLGSGNFVETYKTSKARICVTVGMMTTGYDCPDILNLGLFRPIFSPTDFIQIKGRGTRKHNFLDQLFDESLRAGVQQPEKVAYKLFDFFATCEYFEEEFDYDEVLKLPPLQRPPRKKPTPDPDLIDPPLPVGAYEYQGEDILASLREETIGFAGMRIDRDFFRGFAEVVQDDPEIVAAVEAGQWDQVVDYVNRELLETEETPYSLERLSQAAEVDRRLTLREILEKIFGLIPRFKSKDELLEAEFAKFVEQYEPPANVVPFIKTFFKAYATSPDTRDIVDKRQFGALSTNAAFSTDDFRAVPPDYRALVPQYIQDHLSLEAFAS